MSTLDALFPEHDEALGCVDIECSGVTCDSRRVKQGWVFFALSGSNAEGSDYLEEAVSNGAIAIAGSKGFLNKPIEGIVCIELEEPRRAYARACAVFAGEPSRSLRCIGVTGTNGKTSVSWILAQLASDVDSQSVIVGTLGMGVLPNPEFRKTQNTTPSSEELQNFLNSAARESARFASIEATSQGIAHNRTVGIHWDAAIFTNLTRDHLDLHGDIENYASLKRKLFSEELRESEKAATFSFFNLDDSWGQTFSQEMKQPEFSQEVATYSTSNPTADIYAIDVKSELHGLTIQARIFDEVVELKSALVGDFNVGNILVSVATLFKLGLPLESLVHSLPKVPCVPGRLQRVEAKAFSAFVDYAHTPDALRSVLSSLRILEPKRIITVFGCGGDRDRGKRALMAEAVAELSDVAVATSDNPRTEVPSAIIEDIRSGFPKDSSCIYEEREGRKDAISHALDLAREGDIVLIAGKGHEDYQEIKGVRHPFDDSRVCLELMVEKDLV